MAQPITQDTQKVFRSATGNLMPFTGSVKGVSGAKRMQDIYANMSKLFDTFTSGALLGQGANSETLLRTVYRSLDEDFLEIVQDSEAVDRLIQVIKDRQKGLSPQNVSEAMVSETTKKVVTKTLDPDTCDPMQVVLDFMDELQTSILQVKLNLSREYERRMLERAKSEAGQQEDLDRLRQQCDAQSDAIAQMMEQTAQEEGAWKDVQIGKLQRWMDMFSRITETSSDSADPLVKAIRDDPNLAQMSRPQRKVDWNRIISEIRGQRTASTPPPIAQTNVQTPGAGMSRATPSTPSMEGMRDSVSTPKRPEQSKQPEQSKPNGEDTELKKVIGQVQGLGKSLSSVQRMKPPGDGAKLRVSPSMNGMCVCPICGQAHPLGASHVHTPATQLGNTGGMVATSGGQGSSGISKEGILAAMGKMHTNLTRQIQSKRFRDAFTPNYSRLQTGVAKQMKRINGTEESVSNDLERVKSGIASLKGQARVPGLIGLLLGGMSSLAFTALGGLVLITLTRLAMGKWAATYMPPDDGSQFSIFGVEIPHWGAIKSIGIGLWNFITVGLPNHWDRLKHFMGNINRKLFGKKGAFKDAIESRNTVRKIIGALIIANTQKVAKTAVKWIFKILGWVFCWIPGVKPVCDFLSEFLPKIWTFVADQLMLLWSNNKAATERSVEASAYNQIASGRKQVMQMRHTLFKNARKVTPFKGQLHELQGLQSKRSARPGYPPRKAIMRSIPIHYNNRFEESRKLQEADQEKAKEMAESEVEERLKQKKRNDILVSLNGMTVDAAQWVNDYRKKNGSFGLDKDPVFVRERQRIHLELNAIIEPQIKALDKYIAILAHSTRFKNVKGPLYDPVTGWNRGYRVMASDLRTVIPLTPFESIHRRPDIYFGKPVGPEADSIGFMPFTWMQGQAKISVHPVYYEMARAMGIRAIYNHLRRHFVFADWGDIKPADMAEYAKQWVEWNSALGPHAMGGEYLWMHERNILFRDRFHKFIERFRKGEIKANENSLDTAKRQGQGYLESAVETVVDFGKNVKQGVVKYADDFKRVTSYDKGADKGDLADDESLSWWERTKRFAKRQVRKAGAFSKLHEWSKAKYAGIEYGDVCDFWLDSGILELFSNRTIAGTAGAALPIVESLIDQGMLPKAPKADKANHLHDLMHWFFNKAGITGYQWKDAMGDMNIQTGFAQSLLEYLNYRVLPQWNAVEGLLSDHFTYDTKETAKKLAQGIATLNTMMSQEGIFAFMHRHLRFPHMTVRVIDYRNANSAQVKILDKYRTDMGIPDASTKPNVIKLWKAAWDRVGSMSDNVLDKSLGMLKKMMVKAEFEARFTGDYTYLKLLGQYWERFSGERQARLDRAAQGSAIVQRPGQVAVKVIPPPPKTMEEIEEEKRKAEQEEAARKAEKDRKEKEEREKKLKEEAKRKEALAIANAKIKAMEAIRKQEENYEAILQKMISDPGKVSDSELKSLGDEVKNLKQEAENKIARLPREERELKLALIRGDRISEKTFSEIKETAIGLHGNLQEYMDEVNRIPVGNFLAIHNAPDGGRHQIITMQDSDSVDLGD